jgi:hypothetical protein
MLLNHRRRSGVVDLLDGPGPKRHPHTEKAAQDKRQGDQRAERLNIREVPVVLYLVERLEDQGEADPYGPLL